MLCRIFRKTFPYFRLLAGGKVGGGPGWQYPPGVAAPKRIEQRIELHVKRIEVKQPQGTTNYNKGKPCSPCAARD